MVPTKVFSCCKCGALLFRKDQIVSHTPGEQELLFEKKKHVLSKGCALRAGSASSTHLHVLLPLLLPSLGQTEGSNRVQDLLPKLQLSSGNAPVAGNSVFLYPSDL